MQNGPVVVQIRDFIVNNFLFGDKDALLPDSASLLEKGVIDSTGVLDLVLFLEQQFGISVADEDVTPDNFDSIDVLARYVLSKTDSAVGSAIAEARVEVV